ncbi:MAG: DUF4129 domain-containing protein [Pseudomonadota bacterium]
MTGRGRHIGRMGAGCLLASTLALALVLPLAAQEIDPSDLVDTGPRDERYADTVSGTRIESEILYIGPDVPFSAEATVAEQQVEVEPPRDREAELELSRWTWGIVFAAILVAVIVIFVMNGGGIAARFGSPDEDGRMAPDARRTGPLGTAIDDGPVEQFLAKLAVMKDRREALILLVGRALEDAAQTNELRLGRAQTARDALRALPSGWRHLGALGDLVRQAELVHFGGRDITEDRWRECLAAATPILRRAA